jgi:hypothetical protein
MNEVVAMTDELFATAVEREGTVIHAWFEGTADHGAACAVEGVLARIQAEAMRLALTLAVVDLRRLEAISYSCLRSFISWLADIQELAEDHRYRVMFLFHPALRWQRRGLDVLRCLAPDLVVLTDTPGVT